ncbi:MAG: hypothetical protein P4L53_14750 [Candidatus Obscuribacterales bacterium]|nr:hypothetical protein [Candidatus Obscuribacterales bacterium]
MPDTSIIEFPSTPQRLEVHPMIAPNSSHQLSMKVFKEKFIRLALNIVALQILVPLYAEAASNSNEFMYLNQSELQWQKSPNGYDVASGRLLILRGNGAAALMACSFYRDYHDSKLTYGDVGGFRLEAGSWVKENANPGVLTLKLRLIDQDKGAKSTYDRERPETAVQKFALEKAGSLKNTMSIKDDHGIILTRIADLKNQKELDRMLDGIGPI